MSPPVVGIIGLVILFALMVARVPIALCFGIVGFFGSVYFVGFHAAATAMALYSWSQTIHYTLMCLPLFILMGQFISVSGLGRDLYNLFYRWMGRLKGGLALSTIGACAAFGAVSGSSLSGVVTMGTIAYPQMRRFNYDKKLAAGSIATAGTLAIMIPPSALFIIYATMTETSVGRLFIAGLFPGLLLAGALMAMIMIRVKFNPQLAPAGPSFSWKEKFQTLPSGGVVVALFLMVMGGIYLGWFTATEASAIGAFLAFLFAIGKRQLNWQSFRTALTDTGRVTCMVFFIIILANFYGYFLGLSRLPFVLAAWITGLPLPPLALVALILAIYIPLGMVMEVLAMLVLTLPIFYPTVLALGFHPIWFGVMVTMMAEVAQITPPVGLAVYVIKGIALDTTLEEIFAGIFPFVLTILLVACLILFFPQIALFLPSLM